MDQNQGNSTTSQNTSSNLHSQTKQNGSKHYYKYNKNRRNNHTTRGRESEGNQGTGKENSVSKGNESSGLNRNAPAFVPQSVQLKNDQDKSKENQGVSSNENKKEQNNNERSPRRNYGNRYPHRYGNNNKNRNNKDDRNKNQEDKSKSDRENKSEQNYRRPKYNKSKPIDSSKIEDLRERLEYELLHETYSCSICFNKVHRNQAIYSCPRCYGIVHLSCMSQWVLQSLDDELKQQIPKNIKTPKQLLNFLVSQQFNAIDSKCPRCRQVIQFSTRPSGCFCGVNHEKSASSIQLLDALDQDSQSNLSSGNSANSFSSLTPHSCGYVCNRPSSDHCTHHCTELCHAGPCPPCTVLVTKQCECGKEQITVQCCNSNKEVHCKNICGKLLACKEHYCQRVCHSGDCGKCTFKIDVSCYCGKEHKLIECGDIDYQLRSRYPDDPHLLKHYSSESISQTKDYTINKSIYTNESFDDLDDLSEEDENQPTEIHNQEINEASEQTVPEYHLKTYKEAGVGGYSCHQICNKILECQYHQCKKECHPGDCGKCEGVLAPDARCPCGKCLCSDLAPNRRLCIEPIPTCDNICDKLLPCGLHHCKQKCHIGPCPTCTEPVEQKCRCRFNKRTVPCWVANKLPPPSDLSHEEIEKLTEPFICRHVCHNLLSCKKHYCQVVCCPYRGQTPKGSIHQCTNICNALLNCGIHHCTQPCHPGNCMPCGHIYFEPLSCACGRTVIQPPITCGTRVPECKYPCTKKCPNGHSNCPPHNCHEGPCPPCTAYMDKLCVGQHQIIRHVPCWNNDITCNNICGRELKCGHICKRLCHKLPCDKEDNFDVVGCGQPCGKLRKYCSHTCQAPCHPGQPCPDVPCQCLIELRCPCGRRVETEKCMIGGLQPNENMTQEDIEKIYQEMRDRKLECDEKCQIIMRNIRLATALQVGPALQQYSSDEERRRAYEQELLVCPYSKSLMIFAATKPTFAERLVQTYDKLVVSRAIGKEVELPSFYAQFEQNIRELADFYGIEITITPHPQKITAKLTQNPHRPELSLMEAYQRIDTIAQGTRLHAQQPLPEKATEKDFATLYIYDYKRDFDRNEDLLAFLDAIFPRGKYHIRRWLKPNGLLVLFLTEEIARQAKTTLEQHHLHLRVVFWAERPEVDDYKDLDEMYNTSKKHVEFDVVKPKYLNAGNKEEENVSLYYNPWSILDTSSSEDENEVS